MCQMCDEAAAYRAQLEADAKQRSGAAALPAGADGKPVVSGPAPAAGASAK